MSVERVSEIGELFMDICVERGLFFEDMIVKRLVCLGEKLGVHELLGSDLTMELRFSGYC